MPYLLCTTFAEPWDMYHALHEDPDAFTRCLPNTTHDQENLARLNILREKYKKRLTQLDLEVKALQEKIGEGEYQWRHHPLSLL